MADDGHFFSLKGGGGGGGVAKFMVGAGGFMIQSCQWKGHICIFQ